MTNARERSNELAALLRDEQAAMADFLLALAAFDREKLWRALGHTSLFSYLRRELRLSAGAAQYRKTAAELIRHFPEVEAALRSGRLCLSTIIEVAKVLTRDNTRDVLPRFFGLSRREAELVAAEVRPAEVIPRRTVVIALRPVAQAAAAGSTSAASSGIVPRPPPSPASASAPMKGLLPEPAEAGETVSHPFRPAETNESESQSPLPDERPACGVDPAGPAEAVAHAPVPEPLRLTAPPKPPRASAEPLDAELSRFHATVSRQFLAKLAAAKDALSHAKPGATEEEILEAGLDLLLAAHAKRTGLVDRPRKVPPPAKPDAIPAHVKRAVWRRAGGRCEFCLDSGEVCGSTAQLEFDHHPIPRAHGGPATIENVRIACKPHNLLAARRIFGDACMDRYAGSGRQGSSPDAPEHAGPPTG
jgi:hypothetical protein